MATIEEQSAAAVNRRLAAGTLCEAFQMTARDHAHEMALRTQGGELEITWAQYAQRTRALAAGLAARGLGRGETLGLMLVNRPEFHLIDNAATHLGAIPFSIYNTSAPDQIEFLLTDARCRVVATERAFMDRIGPVARAAGVESVIVVDQPGALEHLEADGDPDFDFERAWRAVLPEDVLTLIYTSGTTGPPKGVQITHANYMSEARGLPELTGLAGGRMVSYLPMAHIAERAATHNLPRVTGATVTCCPDPRMVFDCVREVRPTAFFAVPRVWEKLKTALEAGLAAEPDEQRRAALAGAFEACTRRVETEQAGLPVSTMLADRADRADEQVMSALRAAIGLDQLRWVLVGAAPTPREVLVFFHAMGIPITEIWGLSETTGAATSNPPERIKLGSVGRALAGVQIKLDSDGEVLVRGGIVMPGYRNAPERNAEAFTADGWFRTGDIGRLDEDGYLWIVDRKKELIINAAGKNMSPASIEAQLTSASAAIGHAIALGDNRPYNVALIVLDPEGAAQFASARGGAVAQVAELARDPAVLGEVQAAVARANGQLARVEQIKRYMVLPVEWLPGGEELTPTLKLRRRPIIAKYAAEIEALYDVESSESLPLAAQSPAEPVSARRP
jgi:long-chain acyl-CoA synthetase